MKRPFARQIREVARKIADGSSGCGREEGRMGMRSRPWGVVTFLMALVLWSVVPAGAQTTGRITGTIVDQQGAAVPGVTVTATSPALQGQRDTVTDTSGEFRLQGLPPGQYLVRATLSGFKTVELPIVTVNLDQTVTLPITMEVASVTETVTVQGASPVVDTTSTTGGIVAGAEMFNQLPVRRDFYAISRLAPGVTSDYYGPAFLGSTSAENQYIIDGLNTTGIGTGTQGKTLNFDFIQEVEVKTGGLNAEYGRLTGGALNVLTKSGGNAFHGDVFGFGEPQQDATTGPDLPQWATTTFNTSRRADFGLDVGGFILKDQLWFFGAYDHVNKRDRVSVVRFISPTAPAPGSDFNADLTRNDYAGKLTWKVANNHTISGSVFGDPNTLDGPVITTVNPPGYQILGAQSTFSGTLDKGGTDSTVRYDGVLTSRTFLRATFGQHREKQVYGGVGAVTPAFLDQTQTPTAASGGFGTGFENEHFKRNVFKADLTQAMSSHEVKVGGDFENIDSNVERFAGGGGQRVYKFAAGSVIFYRHRYFVNDRAAGFSRTDPTTWQMAFPLLAAPVTKNASFYAQDSYKVVSNFTINYGLRWESQNVQNRDQQTAFNLKKNWAPRVGFVWDPMKNSRSKMYANWGRFYEAIPMDINIRSFGGELTAFSYNFDPNPANILPNPAAPRRSSLLGGSVTPVDPSLKGQYIDEWVGGAEYEVMGNTVASARVAYRKLGRVIEDFLVPAQGEYFIANPGEGTLGQTLGFYDGVSTAPAPKPERKNTSVELSLRKRYSNNWQFLGSYVWSKLEGNYDGVFQNSTGQLDPNINSAFDYGDFLVNAFGNLTNDRRQQVKLDGSYVFGGRTEGLNVGGSFHWFSGSPLTAYGYSFAYSNWEYYLTPRGSLGRGPAEWEGDVHVGYPVKLGSTTANLLLDVFNVFNRQKAVVLDQRYNLTANGVCGGIPASLCNGDGGLVALPNTTTAAAQLPNPRASAANPDFLIKATQFTPPRSIRFGVRVTF